MSERLSAEERATRAINKATSAWKTNLKASPPFWGITQQEVAKEIKLAEKAAAEAEREGLQREHRACEDAYVKELESLRETVQTQSFELEELRKPITDKSICQRGHPKACLVQVKGVGVQGEVGGELKPMPPPPKICIACTQLEAELKPLREALNWALGELSDRGYSEVVPKHDCGYTGNPEGAYCEFCDEWVKAQEALRRNRG